MSDDQHLELLKRRRLQEMRRRLLLNKTVELEEKSGEAEDPRQVLRKAGGLGGG